MLQGTTLGKKSGALLPAPALWRRAVCPLAGKQARPRGWHELGPSLSPSTLPISSPGSSHLHSQGASSGLLLHIPPKVAGRLWVHSHRHTDDPSTRQSCLTTCWYKKQALNFLSLILIESPDDWARSTQRPHAQPPSETECLHFKGCLEEELGLCLSPHCDFICTMLHKDLFF